MPNRTFAFHNLFQADDKVLQVEWNSVRTQSVSEINEDTKKLTACFGIDLQLF